VTSDLTKAVAIPQIVAAYKQDQIQFQTLAGTRLGFGAYRAGCVLGICMKPEDRKKCDIIRSFTTFPVLTELVRFGGIITDDLHWLTNLQITHDAMINLLFKARTFRDTSKGANLHPDVIEKLTTLHENFCKLIDVEPTFNIVRLASVPMSAHF
jgi:hypothetical protein